MNRWLGCKEGNDFRPGRPIIIGGEKGRRPLVPDFAASADPSVSFDGQECSFAGKAHAEDPWQIWESNLAGGESSPDYILFRKTAFGLSIFPMIASFMRVSARKIRDRGQGTRR